MLPIYGSYVNYVSYHIIEIMLYFIIQKLLYYRSHDTHLQKSCNLSYYRSYAIFHNLEVILYFIIQKLLYNKSHVIYYIIEVMLSIILHKSCYPFTEVM